MRAGFKPKYFTQAFLFHWNLLFVGSGAVAGFILGISDIAIPLLAGIEVVYLAVKATRPGFQAAVDRAERKKGLAPAMTSPEIKRMLDALPPDDRNRYQRLREQIDKLHRISWGAQGDQHSSDLSGLTDVEIEGVNRLLDIYLKLLYSKNRLTLFFENADEATIRADIKYARSRLKELREQENSSARKNKHQKALQDTLKTSHHRLKNYQSAMENHDFITLEIRRLQAKIAGLVEMGVNRHHPDKIISEIDSVAASIRQTEKALAELELIDGFESFS